MSEDRREAILSRLHEIAKGLVGPENAFRNQIDIPEGNRPAIVIFDADEGPDPNFSTGGTRPAFGPVKVNMTPEIYLLLADNIDDAGPALNALRCRVIKAVITDQSLVGICADGDIRYEGFATGFSLARAMEAEAGISFSFLYMVRPKSL